MPKPEQILWYYLRKKQVLGIKFRRQVSIGRYIVDFYAPSEKLIIEVDGDSHFESEEVIEKERRRTEYLEKLGFKILHFYNTDIIRNTESCVEKIKENLRIHPS